MRPASAARGWLLLVCGLFLVLFMGSITLNIAPSMLNPGKDVAGSTFSGSAEQARIFLGLFALVILCGIMSTIYGIFMIVTRRQSIAFIAISLAIAAALVVVAGYILLVMK